MLTYSFQNIGNDSLYEYLYKCIKKDIIILSGDNENIVKDVAKKVKIDKYYAGLLPKDKVKYVNEYKEKGTVMFIGDGINDAPVIKKSTVGVSMGNVGSDAAIEASDVVLMKDNLMKIKEVINISKFTKKKIKQKESCCIFGRIKSTIWN